MKVMARQSTKSEIKTGMPVCERRGIRRKLLAWYDRCKRDLPWRRRHDDPYAQLLAEFMLQQTQVSTVTPFYERFIQRFPDVRSLAAAGADDVLAMWSGLGYYSRARHLHRAAQEIVQRFGGTVPRLVDELITLPGIGRYTAGAIASVAYDTPAPVLDGNVIRVLMRLRADRDDPKSVAVRSRLWAAAEALIPQRRCGDFNQGLMELGATICLPRNPQCLLCPIQAYCRAREAGLVEQIPAVAQRTPVKEMSMVTAAIHHRQKLMFVQRPLKGLWAGLWELPSETLRARETVDNAWVRLRKNLMECDW